MSFLDKLNCDAATVFISENGFLGKTTEELLTALELNYPDIYQQAIEPVQIAIGKQIIANGNFVYLEKYRVGNVEFDHIDDANRAVQKEKLTLFINRALDFVVNKIVVTESGDETWSVIDIGAHPEDGMFAVFNPISGVYTKVTGRENAVATLNMLKEEVVNSVSIDIYRKVADALTQESAWVLLPNV